MAAGQALNISKRHIYVPQRMKITLYICANVYKYAVQDLHRKQVHVSSVPRHCVPSEISRAIGDGTETRSINQHANMLENKNK